MLAALLTVSKCLAAPSFLSSGPLCSRCPASGVVLGHEKLHPIFIYCHEFKAMPVCCDLVWVKASDGPAAKTCAAVYRVRCLLEVSHEVMYAL